MTVGMEEIMVILIVDDQTNVVSGLISGINWDRLQVTKVLKAYNTFEAKAILGSQMVDIMLCDIEMPAEDGLSLLRWVKNNNLNLECIFLTAHADFIYAKEAIQLGGFDYILQPARYEDIENSIIRAQHKIINNRKNQELSSYGQILYNKKDLLVNSILKDWFMGKETNVNRLLDDFKKLDINIGMNSKFYLVLFNILRWHPQAEHWETQLFKDSLHNIISELYEHYGQKALLTEMDKDNYIFILYNQNNQLIDEAGLIRQLEYFIQVCKNFFMCSISCYTGGKTSPAEISLKTRQLTKMKNDNVTLISKVFFDDNRNLKTREKHELHNMKHWVSILTGGSVKQVRDEIMAYLRKLSDEEQLNADSLKRFYQSYLQMLFQVAEVLNIPIYSLFQDKEILEKSLNCYQNIDQMYEFINLSLDFFEDSKTMEIDTKNQIDLIIQYIHKQY